MEILLKDLSGKPEPGMKRFRHLCGRSGVGGGGFSLVSGSFYNEALFPGGTEGECAEWCTGKISFVL
jgi:hypothetical protein